MDLEWRCESLGYDGASDVRRLRAVAMEPLWLGAAAGELQVYPIGGDLAHDSKAARLE